MEGQIDQNNKTQNHQPSLRSIFENLLLISGLPFVEIFTTFQALAKLISYLKHKFAQFFLIKYKIARINEKLKAVANYAEYQQLAAVLDQLEGNIDWKYDNSPSKYFDSERVRSSLNHLRSLREANDVKGLMHLLSSDLVKNFGGAAFPQMHKVLRNGTKLLIENYHNEVIKCIQLVYYYEGPEVSMKQKLDYFSQTRHSLGRTAIFLSGGGGFGKFHYGVLKALYEQDLMPRIIVGASVGACVAV